MVTKINVEYNKEVKEIAFPTGVGNAQDIKDTLRASFSLPTSSGISFYFIFISLSLYLLYLCI